MLTVTRRRGEGIVITTQDGTEIRVVTSSRTRLSVDAPEGVSVLREEIAEKKKKAA